jgi:UDP-glucose 4-epimerase
MILITGSDGFIGSHLTLLVRRQYWGEKIFLLSEAKYNLVTGKNLDKIPQNPRLVIHLAAATDTSKRDQKCNNIGTENLIKALKEIGPKTHFVFTSSLAVYSGRHDTQKPIDKNTQPAPSNAYGKTKLEAERILINAAKDKGFGLTIIRLPTVWGDNPRKNSFLNFLKGLVKSDSVFSKLNWPGKTGLINVDDAASYILKMAENEAKKTTIIPISAENLTLSEIFKTLTLSEGKTYKQIKIPNFVWNLAGSLKNYLKYFEFILPVTFYNYFWRASIVVDSPLWCKVNVKGTKFTTNKV